MAGILDVFGCYDRTPYIYRWRSIKMYLIEEIDLIGKPYKSKYF